MSNVERARIAWMNNAPDWVMKLAELCDEKSQSIAAREMGYTTPVVSQILGNKYRGSIDKVESAVRGLLMNQTVICPVLDEIATNTCIETQRRPFRPTNSTRVQLYKACRAGCANFKGNKGNVS